MTRRRSAWLVLVLLGGWGCVAEDPGVMPDFEWQGEWIDVWGFDRLPEDTCAGTFAYLDAFAGEVAQEYGLSSHFEPYRWYARERFEAEDPCRGLVWGCAGLNGAFSYELPFEHEVVHLANIETFYCPVVLSEGLAEYYGTTSQTPGSGDIRKLLEAQQGSRIASSDYPIAGAFAAYLVEAHGLETVLEACAQASPSPTPEQLAEAMASAFGMSVEQLVTGFDAWRALGCSYSQYRAKLFECGTAPTVVLGSETVEIPITLDCADAGTIGPRNGSIWTLDRIRVTEPGIYVVAIEDDAGVVTEVGLDLIECGQCMDDPKTYSYLPDPEWGGVWIEELEPGDYSIRLWGEPTFARDMILSFSP